MACAVWQLAAHQPLCLFLNHPAGLCPLKQDRTFSCFSPQRHPVLLTLCSHFDTTVTQYPTCYRHHRAQMTSFEVCRWDSDLRHLLRRPENLRVPVLCSRIASVYVLAKTKTAAYSLHPLFWKLAVIVWQDCPDASASMATCSRWECKHPDV